MLFIQKEVLDARSSGWRPAGLLALSLLLASPALATVVVPAEFGEMVNESQTIVHGRVVDVRAQLTGGRRTIESIVTVAILESLKGDAARTISFRVPNGQVGRYRRVMVGAPEFTAGDEVVLFLKGRPPVLPMPYGLTQGVYRVARAPDGRAVVRPLVADGPGRVVRGDPARRPLAIEAFTERIRAAARAR